MEWFYDRKGIPQLFQYNNRLISKNGKNLCWIVEDRLYSLYNGNHIGWFLEDKIYDINNRILAFKRNAQGLPYIVGLAGAPGIPGIPSYPSMPGLGAAHLKPYNNSFSNIEDVISYFLERR